jgi:hypothetical protein
MTQISYVEPLLEGLQIPGDHWLREELFLKD